jgi:hypothetical protein
MATTPTQIQQTQVGFAPEIAPFATTLLGQAQAFSNPNIPAPVYGGDRFAQFTPMQKQSYEGAQQMQPSYQLTGATGLAGLAGQQALNTQYSPMNYQSGSITGGMGGGNTNAYGGFGGPAVMPQQGGYGGGQGMPNYGGMGIGRAAPTEADWNMMQQMGQFAPGTDMAQAKADFMGGGKGGYSGPEMGAYNPAGNIRSTGMPMEDVYGGEQPPMPMVQRPAGGFGGQQPQMPQAPKSTLEQYMSPYVQNVVERQQQDATRQAAIAQQAQQAQAAKAGAFGGSGDYLMRSQAASNLARQKGDIQATGMQNAYTQALNQFNQEQQQRQQAAQLSEQSRQYGAGLGLQGLQTALTGAGQLNTIGQTQFGQGMDINKLQNTYGGQQQQQMQNILGAQYQSWLDQQNQPYKQMGFMSDIIRGAPLSQMGSTVYSAAPSAVSQLAGLGATAYGASMKAGGGSIKEQRFAKGGMVQDVTAKERPAGLAELAIYKLA